LIVFISQHPVPLLRMTWEGLYVALSRVKYSDHIRLAIKNDDRSSLSYIENLSRNKYTDWFFRGFEHVSSTKEMNWKRSKAREAAGFDKKKRTSTARARSSKCSSGTTKKNTRKKSRW